MSLADVKKDKQIVYFSDVFIFHFISYDDMNNFVKKRNKHAWILRTKMTIKRVKGWNNLKTLDIDDFSIQWF